MEQTDGQNYGTAFSTKDTCHATFKFAQNKEPEETAVLMWPSELDTAYMGSQLVPILQGANIKESQWSIVGEFWSDSHL